MRAAENPPSWGKRYNSISFLYTAVNFPTGWRTENGFLCSGKSFTITMVNPLSDKASVHIPGRWWSKIMSFLWPITTVYVRWGAKSLSSAAENSYAPCFAWRRDGVRRPVVWGGVWKHFRLYVGKPILTPLRYHRPHAHIHRHCIGHLWRE